MSTNFEIWDAKTRNILQFDRLDQAVTALRGLIERNGDVALKGLSLDAVSESGEHRMTLAEDDDLLGLISAAER